MAKKKTKYVDEPGWGIKVREGGDVTGEWFWLVHLTRDTRREAIEALCKDWDLTKAEWRSRKRKDINACVKVKLVEQP